MPSFKQVAKNVKLLLELAVLVLKVAVWCQIFLYVLSLGNFIIGRAEHRDGVPKPKTTVEEPVWDWLKAFIAYPRHLVVQLLRWLLGL